MDGYNKTKPLYFFVLRTGKRPALDLRDSESDRLLRQLIADNSSRIFRKEHDKKRDVNCEEPLAAISGSSLALGCWSSPKTATSVSKDLHILAINNEISWSEYKWVDLNGYGMHMPAGGYDESTGFSYEPRAHHNRLLDTRVPEPGKEIAIISEKWGVIGSNIKYVSLGAAPDVAANNNKEKIDAAVEEKIEAQMMETTSTTPERSPPSQQSTPPQAQPTHITNSEDTNKTQVKSNGHATRLAKDATTAAAAGAAAQGGAGEESTSVRMRHKPRLHAHRATMELEPEEDMDDSYIDPNYGIKPQPYKFGQKLSVKLPWKKEKTRDTGSEPPSCSSSVSSVEGVGGETWTKTGSLPALFRKRGKRPAEAVPADAADDTLKQSGAPAATNGAVPEPKTHKLGRMRRFRNSLSDLMKSKRSKP